jgi:outer membrane protein, multidrug efflux system
MSPVLTRALVATLSALVGACTLEPAYHRPVSPALPIEDISKDGVFAADVGWREFFVDPQLQQLIALALVSNRDLRVAALSVREAQAQYRIQRADLFPTINASGAEQIEELPAGVIGAPGPGGTTAATGTNESTLRFYNVGIGFTSYELDLFGRIQSLNHAALEQYFSYIETRRSVQLSLVAEVASAYLSVLTDQTLLDLTRDTLRNQDESYALTRRMFQAGTSSELALRQAETTVDAARVNVAQYTRRIAQDRHALEFLLGSPIPANIAFSGGLDRGSLVADIVEGVPSDVLVYRPDVLAAERQLRSANAQLGAARAAFFPAISLTGSFGTASTQLAGLFKGDSRTWTFSPQISVPIFAGGANYANLLAIRIARETAVAQYEKAIQGAFREVADALVARSTLDEQLQAQQALTDTSLRAYRLADMRFRGGVDSYLTALDAQRALYGAQQELQNVRLMRLQALITLYKALGGGLLERSADKSPSVPPLT